MGAQAEAGKRMLVVRMAWVLAWRLVMVVVDGASRVGGHWYLLSHHHWGGSAGSKVFTLQVCTGFVGSWVPEVGG